ncbi:MAG: protein kinase domain-containing protein [Pseudonocardiaceae bacterium]
MWAWGKTRKTGQSWGSVEEIDGYRDLVQVGQGGFGVVYRARQEHLDREVAVKVLAVPALDEAALSRFERECQLTSRLTGHPNVVTVLDTGTARSGRPYVATEYFEHGSLKQRLDRDGPLPLKEALRVGVKVASALAAAHDAGILHRDIKPENILVSGYGEPALADFGVARLLDTSDLSTRTDALTIHHIAPEILEDTPPSPASDVYALGSTLYQLLSGYPPHRRSSDESIASELRCILSEDPPDIARPDVPEQVMAIVRKAMARQQQNRFADPLALAAALQHLQAEYGFTVTELSPIRDQTQSRSPNSPDTVLFPQSAGAESSRSQPDSGVSSAVRRPRRAPHHKAPSKHHRWGLALVSLLAIVTTVGGFVTWRTRISADSTPQGSVPARSAPGYHPLTTTPLPLTPISMSPSTQSGPPEPATSSPQGPPQPLRPGRPPTPQSTPAATPVSGPQATPLQQPPASNPVTGFHIRNQYSGKCLVAPSDSGDSLVRQVECDLNDPSQRWQLPDPRDDNPNVFQIRNVKYRNCITSDPNALATVITCEYSIYSWEFLAKGGVTRLNFKNPYSKLCLIAENKDVGGRARLSTCQGSSGELWDIY